MWNTGMASMEDKFYGSFLCRCNVTREAAVGALAGADATSLREQVKTSRFSNTYIDGLEKAKKVIIDSQYVDKSERLWN
jgi:hypothetical protein